MSYVLSFKIAPIKLLLFLVNTFLDIVCQRVGGGRRNYLVYIFRHLNIYIFFKCILFVELDPDGAGADGRDHHPRRPDSGQVWKILLKRKKNGFSSRYYNETHPQFVKRRNGNLM